MTKTQTEPKRSLISIDMPNGFTYTGLINYNHNPNQFISLENYVLTETSNHSHRSSLYKDRRKSYEALIRENPHNQNLPVTLHTRNAAIINLGKLD